MLTLAVFTLICFDELSDTNTSFEKSSRKEKSSDFIFAVWLKIKKSYDVTFVVSGQRYSKIATRSNNCCLKLASQSNPNGHKKSLS